MESHGAAARRLLGANAAVIDQIFHDLETAKIDERMRCLLHIADKVRVDGRLVTDEDVARARAAGADDRAIHDTVLVAALFSMFNRYVDGLATLTPRDPAVYREIGERIATKGYGSLFREGKGDACPDLSSCSS
jgi:alkylhydroperoxidase family enzyme